MEAGSDGQGYSAGKSVAISAVVLVVVVVAISLAVKACGGRDESSDRLVRLVNETGGAVNTSNQATVGDGERGLSVSISVGRSDVSQERIPSLDGIARTVSGESECESRTHGLGTVWGKAGHASFDFLCRDLTADEVTSIEVRAG